MNTLYIMCGVQGAGKSYIAKQLSEGRNIPCISRDDIRFSLLKEGEDYFAHEEEVLNDFYSKINESLKYSDTIADSTLVSPKARRNFLKHIKTPCFKIIIVCEEELYTCLKRNNERTGIRKVPEDAIINTYNRFLAPTPEEGFDIVYNVKR